jgi:hypothetical protein
MGQAKIKQQAAFPESLIASWEADQCVDFAVGLARITGWLLHVDWWVPSIDPDTEIPIEMFKPLRVYVADNAEKVFDARGIRDIVTFTEKTTGPIARRYGNGGLRTRFYSEAALLELPLNAKPNETKVTAAMDAIRANAVFLSGIPHRTPSSIPAHDAAHFTYGWCAPYAEALGAATGFVPAALLAIRFASRFANTDTGDSGYFHSVVMHPNGKAEDSWGIASAKQVAERFGVLDFEISYEEHARVVATLRRNSPEQFDEARFQAEKLIAAYRGSTYDH